MISHKSHQERSQSMMHPQRKMIMANNRGLYFCKVSHPLEVMVRQMLLLDNSVGRSQTNQQRMESLVKRHKRDNNQPKSG